MPGAVAPTNDLCITVIYNKHIFGHSDDENRFLMCIWVTSIMPGSPLSTPVV